MQDSHAPSPLALPATPDPDEEARRSLRRHRQVATGLLAGMGGVMLGAYALPSGYWAELLQASAKAGLVGGIADWFAVTALFRHPLGLPIPHTAIIPKQKERLGRGLGRFVAQNVFTEAETRQVLARLDLAGVIQRFLSDPETSRPAAEALAGALPRILASIEDGRARRLLVRLAPRMVSGPAAARLMARLLRALIAGGRHQEVFGLALAQIKVLMAAKEEDLKAAIAARVRAEGGALVGWLAGAALARRILGAINSELENVSPGDSRLRAAFEAWLETEIVRLETDPERAEAIGKALRQALAHPSVAIWLGDVWDRVKAALVADAARPDGRAVSLIAGLFTNAGTMLAEDAGAKAKLESSIDGALLAMLPSAQAKLSDFIARVVGNWDTATVVEKLELRVGRDLQYVRINGTLVGFLVGGGLFALLTAIFGHVAH